AYIALTLIGAPYPALLAIIITVLDAIPQVGATIGAVVAVLAALTTSVPVAIATLVFMILYQQLENYLIAPRIFS
ncbi:MAG: AI-2E family transporter, partial [Actinomycetota bacterium]